MSEKIQTAKLTSEEISIPETFLKLEIGLPPMFLAMAGYHGDARFVGLNYYGSKATWHDGRGMATFSYFSVYEPLVNHPAFCLVLRGSNADLGSDDSEATHTLILDRRENSIYLGRCADTSSFLRGQHPPVEPVEMTKEMWAEIEEKLTEQMKDIGSMQMFGMFEMFGPNPGRETETKQLIDWLNSNTPAPVREYFGRLGYKF